MVLSIPVASRLDLSELDFGDFIQPSRVALAVVGVEDAVGVSAENL